MDYLPLPIKVFLVEGWLPQDQALLDLEALGVNRSNMAGFELRDQQSFEVSHPPPPSQAQALPPAPPSTPTPSGGGGGFAGLGFGEVGGIWGARPPGGAASLRVDSASFKTLPDFRPGHKPPGDDVGASLLGPIGRPAQSLATEAMVPHHGPGPGRSEGPEEPWSPDTSPSAGGREPPRYDLRSLSDDRRQRPVHRVAAVQPNLPRQHQQADPEDEAASRQRLLHYQLIRQHSVHQVPQGFAAVDPATGERLQAAGPPQPFSQQPRHGPVGCEGDPSGESSAKRPKDEEEGGSLPLRLATGEKEAAAAAYRLMSMPESDIEVDVDVVSFFERRENEAAKESDRVREGKEAAQEAGHNLAGEGKTKDQSS